ncbi:hypothetical protein POSPLADRAFT_1056102 [Postia placenta MAD-698-R-SB12]|uniref:DUF4939 domain-containing protein n=1 Tax=Postia placenta MAD-698-R-SB12 TaxID=670580 RepID=A0A1X6N295_9APHY|nr:hypothetical protein POSPLADRAFT_1056102 [Postia placenta MAD-698-R-SB12]OSX62737.1 hypothetical protein POSPLADRAFT_1056102 [Postia placenta MAD-698-R-SB12]
MSLPSRPVLHPQAPAFPNLSSPTATPQAIPQPSLGPRLERNPKPEPSDSPAVTWASSSSAISSSTPVPVVRHPASGLPPSPPPPSLPRGRSSTRSSRSSPGGQSQQPSPPAGSPPSPSSLVMSSPASPPNKETLRLLLPLRYDGKTVIECDQFLSQLRIYWLVNMSLTTTELKVQVALSLLDDDTCTWVTPFFAQLVAVQLKAQGVMTPFANEAAFATALKAHFGNLDDEAAAQVELAKLWYGDLELRDKYLSGIPSRVYRKIELETFTMWEDTDKRAMELEEEDEEERAVVHPDHTELRPASTQPSEKETSPAVALAARSKGTVASIASGSTQATTSAPVTTSPSATISAASASPEKSETLAALMAQVKSMREELEHYRAMKEESF